MGTPPYFECTIGQVGEEKVQTFTLFLLLQAAAILYCCLTLDGDLAIFPYDAGLLVLHCTC